MGDSLGLGISHQLTDQVKSSSNCLFYTSLCFNRRLYVDDDADEGGGMIFLLLLLLLLLMMIITMGMRAADGDWTKVDLTEEDSEV